MFKFSESPFQVSHGQTLRALDGLPFMGAPYSGTARALDDAGISSGQTFLMGQLEYAERKLHQPLTNVTWMRDMPVKTGGGFVSNTSNFFVNYATTGANQNGFMAGQTNVIPVMQANVTKDVWGVYPWQHLIRVPLMDQDRMAQAGLPESLDNLLNKGLRLNYAKELDQLVYFGIPMMSITGLVNNTSITTSTAPNGGSGTAWSTKTVQQIMNDINFGIVTAWAAGNYDPDSLPNTVLVPPTQFNLLNNTLISTAGNQSLLSYFMENNIAKAKGGSLKILDCRQCIGAGTSSTDRAVFYRNDEDKIHMNITVPLYRKITQPVVADDSYQTLYESFVGPVKFLYTQPAYYLDGI